MVTFIHDHIFLRYKNSIYTTGSLNEKVMKRYVNIFGEMKLVTRSKEVEILNTNISPSNIDNTYFEKVPDYKSIKKLKNYFRAKKIIKKEVENAEHLILRTSSFANIAAKHAKKIGKPYLVEVVGCAWDASWNYSFLGKIIAPFSYYSQKKTIKEADYAVYVTEFFLQSRYPTKGKQTNCSNVTLGEFDEKTIINRLNKIKNDDQNSKKIIGTTAAINVKYKGQQYIIEALGELKKQGVKNFEYHLVGGGDSTYLKSIAKKVGVLDLVHFKGALSHEDVFKWLDTIDIYAQPSRQEGLPRGLIEAMSKGVPAIGARTAGIPELLENSCIFSNKKTNITEICSLLKSFDKEFMYEQAERNYYHAKKYDISLIEKRRKDFFEEFKKMDK